ncbi:TonB-dependent siderophore receptor [Burkholderia paludis]|uniref:TonB-dependent siderophore receptor n=1 Tax=Burkholderia paludis TaxID=1506587 RepID=UPI001F3E1278|nr:TonB-dependent siderophore receptor [Burkholderia paludis]
MTGAWAQADAEAGTGAAAAPIRDKEEAATLPAVAVTGQRVTDGSGPERGYVAETSSVGGKAPTSVLDTPQSVSVVTRRLMDEQQPGSASQALRYAAGVNSESYGGFGTHLDLTRIRGIDADYYLDGLRVISNTSTWTPQIDPYTLERIEVLRGPASALYGQGTGGGVIDQVSRRPQRDAEHEIVLQAGSYGHRQIGVDSTGPLNAGRTLLYRFTGTGLSDDGQVEDVRHKRVYLAPALTWRPNDRLSWTVLATHVREPEMPDYNSLPATALGLNGSRYPQVQRNRNYTDMDFEGSSRKQDSVSSLLTYRLGDGWQFNSNLRYMYVNSDIRRTSIYGYRDRGGHLWLEGTYGLAPASSHTFQFDNNVAGTVRTGALAHRLLMGVDYAKGRLISDSYRMAPVPFDPYDPVHYRPHATPDFSDSQLNWPYNVRQDFQRIGVYAQDQIAYGGWRLTLGGRYDRSRTDDTSRSYSPVWKSGRQENSRWTGRVGLGYVFGNGVAPYASYATSFDPQLGVDYKGNAFVPVEAKQVEVGVKYHPPGSATLLTVALFQINQTNVRSSDTLHLGYWTQAGELRARGVDLQAVTRLTRDLNLIAGYTYLDSSLVRDSLYQGKTPAGTPRHSASAWLDYGFRGTLAGLRIGGGVRHLGATWGNPRNTFSVPSATLFDLAASYDLGRLIGRDATLSLNVSNLANRSYVASCTSEMYCFIGQDRVVNATLSYRW